MWTITIIGKGGHAKSVRDVINAEGIYRVSDIVDSNEYSPSSGENCVIAIGDVSVREMLWNLLKNEGVKFPVIVSPRAYLADDVLIKESTIIMHYAIVNTGSRIGLNCIINTMACVEHDCIIGKHCHLASGVILGGGCTIGDKVFIGSNATIKAGISICSNVIVGAGAVIVENIKESGTYVGCPGRKI